MLAKQEPKKYELNGRSIKCSACGSALFYERKLFLEQRKFLDGELEVINLTCSECGHIMLFDPYPGAP